MFNHTYCIQSYLIFSIYYFWILSLLKGTLGSYIEIVLLYIMLTVLIQTHTIAKLEKIRKKTGIKKLRKSIPWIAFTTSILNDFLFLFVFFHEKLEVEHLYQLYKSGIWTKSQKGLYYIYRHTMELCNIHIYYGITVTNTSDNLAFWQRTFYLYLHTHNLLTASRLLLITNPLPLTGFLS